MKLTLYLKKYDLQWSKESQRRKQSYRKTVIEFHVPPTTNRNNKSSYKVEEAHVKVQICTARRFRIFRTSPITARIIQKRRGSRIFLKSHNIPFRKKGSNSTSANKIKLAITINPRLQRVYNATPWRLINARKESRAFRSRLSRERELTNGQCHEKS